MGGRSHSLQRIGDDAVPFGAWSNNHIVYLPDIVANVDRCESYFDRRRFMKKCSSTVAADRSCAANAVRFVRDVDHCHEKMFIAPGALMQIARSARCNLRA
jgi:hypothetical protein